MTPEQKAALIAFLDTLETFVYYAEDSLYLVKVGEDLRAKSEALRELLEDE